jgi:hypothetical protein
MLPNGGEETTNRRPGRPLKNKSDKAPALDTQTVSTSTRGSKNKKSAETNNACVSEESTPSSPAGNVSNPQHPPTTPEDYCGTCKKSFYDKISKCIGCDKCGVWYHQTCAGINKKLFDYYSAPNNDETWICKSCKHSEVNQPTTLYWGKCFNNAEGIETAINQAYKEIVGWSKNLFLLPRGKAGKDFIVELTRLINIFVNKAPHERLSLCLVHVFMPIMLQKPSAKSKARDHSKYLAQRLIKWTNGELGGLMAEAREIQKRHQQLVDRKTTNKTKLFCNLMMMGKISQATKLFNQDDSTGGVLSIDDEMLAILQQKHPKAALVREDLSQTEQASQHIVEPVIFESIDETAIQNAAKKTFGSGGPTQVDADGWKHILCSKSYGKLSELLCQSIADMAKRLCTEDVDSGVLKEFLSCRLIPLDKNPGVRPIGVGEVLRRIIGKAIMRVLKQDIVHASGTLQTCAGIESGIEAAIHSMATAFQDSKAQAILLVDATNAFNSMNRARALQTVKSLCPTFHQYLNNTYQTPTHQYISGSKAGHFVWSEEGATQGDNCAMAYYALATRPIIEKLNNVSDAIQVFYADDDSACGTLDELLKYWKELCVIGPEYGYHPNAGKTILIVKNHSDLSRAKDLFEPQKVTITCEGERHLGAVVGSEEYRCKYVTDKVACWVKDVEDLADIAKDEPQLAYACYTKGMSHRWTYVMRTIPGIKDLLAPLEDAIANSLIPAIMGREVSGNEREVMQLPIRFGGLGMPNPVESTDREFKCSTEMTEQLVKLILKQELTLDNLDKSAVEETKSRLRGEKESEHEKQYTIVCSKVNARTKRAMMLAREKGASSWLNALPLKSLSYTLNKQEFRDGIAMRYGWAINDIPTVCVCGSKNSVSHSLDCKKGGFVCMRHDSIRNCTANLLRDAGCKDVQIEPELLPVDPQKFKARTNTQPGARLDVSARGVWSQFERSFYDVRVTHPNCLSNIGKPVADIYIEHQNSKKVEYQERVLQSEKGSFTPLIFTTSGGMGPECSILYKRIAELTAAKKSEQYGSVMNYIRTRLRFAILRSTLIGIRGERGRSNKNFNITLDEISLNLIPEASAYECR